MVCSDYDYSDKCVLDASCECIINGNFVALSIATTGLRTCEDNKICCISAVKYVKGCRKAAFEELVNPHRSIPWSARQNNGIDERKASLAADFYRVWLSFIKFSNGFPIAVYNGNFTRDFIENELPLEFPRPVLVDVMGMIELDIGVRISLSDAAARIGARLSGIGKGSKVLKNAELLGLLVIAKLIKTGRLNESSIRSLNNAGSQNEQLGNASEDLSDKYPDELKRQELDDLLSWQASKKRDEFQDRIEELKIRNIRPVAKNHAAGQNLGVSEKICEESDLVKDEFNSLERIEVKMHSELKPNQNSRRESGKADEDNSEGGFIGNIIFSAIVLYLIFKYLC